MIFCFMFYISQLHAEYLKLEFQQLMSKILIYPFSPKNIFSRLQTLFFQNIVN